MYHRRRLLQIGANDGCGVSRGRCSDPVATLIRQGWGAVLMEPQLDAVAKLQSRHGLNTGIRIVRAALCLDPDALNTTLWSLNLTKNIGMNESDPRCLGNLQTELASLSKGHLLAHQRWYPYTPSQCRKCAATLGRALPSTCLSRVITDNLEPTSVPCGSFERELRHLGEPLAPPELLVSDAEGHDDQVITRYFATGLAPPAFLRYEWNHLGRQRAQKLANLLRDVHGMVPFSQGAVATASWGVSFPLVRKLMPSDPFNLLWMRNLSAPLAGGTRAR
jgi:hypothetical protein